VTFLLHSLIHASNRELIYTDNRWIITLNSIILLVFVTYMDCLLHGTNFTPKYNSGECSLNDNGQIDPVREGLVYGIQYIDKSGD